MKKIIEGKKLLSRVRKKCLIGIPNNQWAALDTCDYIEREKNKQTSKYSKALLAKSIVSGCSYD